MAALSILAKSFSQSPGFKHLSKSILITPIVFFSILLVLNVIRSPIPERLLDSLAYVYVLVFLWYLDACARRQSDKTQHHGRSEPFISLPTIAVSFSLVILTDLLLPTGRFGDYQKFAAGTNASSSAAIKAIDKIEGDKPILATGSTSWIVNSNPWNEQRSIFADSDIFFLGWGVYSPFYTKRELLMNQDVNYLGVAQEKVLLFSQEEERNMVLHFLGEHYGVKGTLEEVVQIYGDLYIYEFVSNS
jgi:hypothetical protein